MVLFGYKSISGWISANHQIIWFLIYPYNLIHGMYLLCRDGGGDLIDHDGNKNINVNYQLPIEETKIIIVSWD